jgi:hypothetical protein
VHIASYGAGALGWGECRAAGGRGGGEGRSTLCCPRPGLPVAAGGPLAQAPAARFDAPGRPAVRFPPRRGQRAPPDRQARDLLHGLLLLGRREPRLQHPRRPHGASLARAERPGTRCRRCTRPRQPSTLCTLSPLNLGSSPTPPLTTPPPSPQVPVDKCGYYEDRRPASNLDPYVVGGGAGGAGAAAQARTATTRPQPEPVARFSRRCARSCPHAPR